MTVDDAKTAFEAIAAGIRGTGGSLEDMKSAMRAVSQVFSKGKVSAEELRQQLGERLPGAFTLFADSMNMTPAMLDKALEQGKVTLEDFMGFANLLFDTYGENAKILASGPEAAGDRLQTAMSELKDNVGQLLRPVGAQFQDTFTNDIIKPINDAAKALRKFYKIGEEFAEERLFDLLTERENLEKRIAGLEKAIPETGIFDYPVSRGSLVNALAAAEKKLEDLIPKIELAKEELKGFLIPVDTGEGEGDKKEGKNPFINNIELGAKAYFDTISDFSKQTQDAVANAFKGMEDALVNFVQTGKLNFSDLARSIMADLTRMLVRASLLNFLSPFPFFNRITGGKNAMGGVYDAGNKISKFAYGGIVKKPTLFPMAQGMGLMGEAGPEAIMPLKRGANGKLGVQSSGGVGNIVVNVDASGSSVQGDSERSQEFGRALAAAIQSEMIKQKRPGGLLT